jgi:hypothetical protein
MHGLHQMSNWLENYFGRTRWNSKVTWVKLKQASVYLEMVLISMLDWSMICAESTMGMEIFLAPPGGPPRWRGLMEAHFGPFGDSVNQHAR